jgi:hypothetical protein
VDNVNCEFTIPPVKNKEDFLKYSAYCKKWANNYLENYGLKLKAYSSYSFTDEDLDNETAQRFGCEPSFDAFRKGRQARVGEPENQNLRSAGFHLHCGFNSENFSTEDLFNYIYCCDLFLGIPSVILDRDTERRGLYGSPSNYRFKRIGNLIIIEYRSLGGNLLADDELIGYCYDQLIAAINFFNESNFESLWEDLPEIIRIIKESDVEGALYIAQKYNLNLLPYSVDKEVKIKIKDLVCQ